MLRLGGRGPLFRMHLDSRHLAEFNLLGRNQCFVRIAELLETMPELELVGAVGFMTPSLGQSVPNLHYLRKVRMDGGAFLRIDGSGEIHTQRATIRSQTRRNYTKKESIYLFARPWFWPERYSGLVKDGSEVNWQYQC